MPAYSTNMDGRYLASNFIPNITIEDEDLTYQNPQLEIFSSQAIKVNQLITVDNYYIYSNEHLPVIARRQKGNTSCWWMILLASNEMHPLEIEPGTTLVLPNIDNIASALNVQSNNLTRIPVFHTI